MTVQEKLAADLECLKNPNCTCTSCLDAKEGFQSLGEGYEAEDDIDWREDYGPAGGHHDPFGHLDGRL